jgi:hypothetical protein
VRLSFSSSFFQGNHQPRPNSIFDANTLRDAYLAVWTGDLREDAHHWTDQVKKPHDELNNLSTKKVMK